MTTTLACRWLDPLTDPLAELRRALVRRAHADIGVEENMGAPNRSPYIDEVITEAGSPSSRPGAAASRGGGRRMPAPRIRRKMPARCACG